MRTPSPVWGPQTVQATNKSRAQSLRAQWEGKANKMVQNGSKQRKETAGQGQFNMLDSLYKYEINLDQVQSIFRATQSDTNSNLFYLLPSPEQ